VAATRNAVVGVSSADSAFTLPAADRMRVVSVVVVAMIATWTAATAAERSASTAAAATARRTRRRGAGVERDHPQNLNPFSTLPDLAMDRRAFGCVLQSGFLQRGDVEEDVRRTIRR
jgi:hypothetical protein